jgi:hypothetical protein
LKEIYNTHNYLDRTVFDKTGFLYKGPADYEIYKIFGVDKIKQIQRDITVDKILTEDQMKSLSEKVGKLQNNFFASQEYYEFIKIFVNKLVDFIIEIIENKDVSTEEKRILLHNIQSIYFYKSPDITERLQIGDLLLITAKANKYEIVRGYFGQKMNGELVYEMSLTGDWVVEHVLNIFKKESVDNQLNILHQLVTTGSAAAGEGAHSRGGFVHIEEIIFDIANGEFVPLVKYFAQVSLKRLKHEEENPSVGILTYEGNNNAGRITENIDKGITQENDKIKSELVLPKQFVHNRAYFVAKDYISVLDSANIPIGLVNIENSTIDKEKLSEGLPVNILYNLEAVVNKQNNKNMPLDMGAVLLLLKKYKIDITQVFPNVLPEEVQKYIQLSEKINSIYDRVTIKKQLGNHIPAWYHKKILEIFEIVNANVEAFFDGFEYAKNEFLKAQKDGYEDGMLNSIQMVARINKIEGVKEWVKESPKESRKSGAGRIKNTNKKQFNQIRAIIARRLKALDNQNMAMWKEVQNVDLSQEKKRNKQCV